MTLEWPCLRRSLGSGAKATFTAFKSVIELNRCAVGGSSRTADASAKRRNVWRIPWRSRCCCYTFIGVTVQQDVIVPGVVVNDQGLVVISLDTVNTGLPDERLKNFKIITPRQDTDNEEVDAEFQGRDDDQWPGSRLAAELRP